MIRRNRGKFHKQGRPVNVKHGALRCAMGQVGRRQITQRGGGLPHTPSNTIQQRRRCVLVSWCLVIKN